MPRPAESDIATVVFPSTPITREEMEGRIAQTWHDHGDLLWKYSQVWASCNHTWVANSFMGVPIMKAPNDLWTYQQIIAGLRPVTIIETGTAYGASAWWFASLLDMVGHPDARVVTVDIEDRLRCRHPRVQYLTGSCLDPAVVDQVRARIVPEAPVLISLDSEHTAQHVYDELCLFAPLVPIGSGLVVEDTNVSWPGHDGGAAEGLQAYLAAHPGEWVQDRTCEKFLLTCHPGGLMFRVGACAHGA